MVSSMDNLYVLENKNQILIYSLDTQSWMRGDKNYIQSLSLDEMYELLEKFHLKSKQEQGNLNSESNIIFQQTQRILEEQKKLSLFSFEDIEETDNLQYDIIIIDFDQLRVCKKDFKIILDIRCRSNIPILALLEKSSVSDQFEVLSMGALDFLERPATDEVYSGKLEQLYQWKWYYDWEKNMHENTIS